MDESTSGIITCRLHMYPGWYVFIMNPWARSAVLGAVRYLALALSIHFLVYIDRRSIHAVRVSLHRTSPITLPQFIFGSSIRSLCRPNVCLSILIVTPRDSLARAAFSSARVGTGTTEVRV